jgi:hypothetical protein
MSHVGRLVKSSGTVVKSFRWLRRDSSQGKAEVTHSLATKKSIVIALLIGVRIMSSQPAGAVGESILLADWTRLRIAAQQKSNQHDDFAALQNWRNALGLADKLGSDSMYRAISLRELAEFLLRHAKNDEAMTLLLQERAIVSAVPNAPMAIDNLAALVQVSAQLGNERLALAFMAHLEKISDFTDDMVVGSAEHIASMYAKLGKTERENEYREQLWKSVAKARGSSDSQTLVRLLNVADSSAKKGNLKIALGHYLQVVREATRKQYNFAEVIKPAISGACTIYHTLHQDDQAEALYSETLNSMWSSLSSEDRAYLFRRLFDTIVWYGSGPARFERAEKTVKEADDLGQRENDHYLLAEAACERAALELQKHGPSRKTLRCIEVALKATKNIANFDADRAWMLKLIRRST